MGDERIVARQRGPKVANGGLDVADLVVELSKSLDLCAM